MHIQRPQYEDFLNRWRDKNVIKVITGVRRCGKSTVMEMFQQKLRAEGVSSERIVSINFELLEFEPLQEYHALYEYVTQRLSDGALTYVFIDEIQAVPSFEKAVNSLLATKKADIYITGSNAHLLSSELATNLSGRYVELNMLPLSFAEFAAVFPEDSDIRDLYQRYITVGSFPGAVSLDSRKSVREYLGGVYNTVVLNDIIERHEVRDSAVLKKITRFLFDNIGNLTTSASIANALRDAQSLSSAKKAKSTSAQTVESYIDYIIDGHLMYRATRYDIRGKERLRAPEKYYAVDLGLRDYLLGRKNTDLGRVLENIVFLELHRRFQEVYIGKLGQNEVDFVAIGEDSGPLYYQVALTVREKQTLERELSVLKKIKDNRPKTIITLDDDPDCSYDGINQVNALRWLVGKNRRVEI